MRSFVACVVVVTSVLGVAHAEPDSLDDLLGPREIAVGEAMRASATGATAIGLNPAGLPLNRELVFEGGYGYRQSDSASLIGVSACDSTNAVPGCFFYSYAGSNPELGGMAMSRTTHIAGSSLSRQITPRVMIGTTTKYFRFDSNVMSEEKKSGFSFDLGATIRLTELINLGVSGQNLWGTEDSTQFPKAVGGGVLARPIPIFALSFDSRWKTDGAGARYGGGAELFLRSASYGFPIRAGAIHDNELAATYVTGGIGIANIKWGIDLAARREVKGGNETMMIASMRFYGPRMPAPGVQ
ncbi:MAG: hypothetical protein H0T42_26605 [Deltaproteobacteria bacterium]|nr:hypothetical protein [Deltaproteobacteria bacterium]